MPQDSFNPKSRFLGRNVCSLAREWTHRHKVNTEDTLSGFQEFFLQPIGLRIGPKKDGFQLLPCKVLEKTNDI